MESEYVYKAGSFEVTDQMKKDYDKNGYILVRNLLSKEELDKLQAAIDHKDGVLKHAYSLNDGANRRSKLCLWNHPGSDVTGMVARCEKVAKTSEKLLGGPCYHYHTKLMMKEAFTGGQFVWHQDYGYWYKNGCLYPNMITAFIAMDRCNKVNGCLQIINGSHKCGRIEHKMVGGQTGADLERVQQILDFGMELKHVEMEPGDALFFDCNLLHKSEPNESKFRRWAFLCSYNRNDNNPVLEHHHPQYTPLEMLPDSAIMDCTNVTDLSNKWFNDPLSDKSVSYTKEDIDIDKK